MTVIWCMVPEIWSPIKGQNFLSFWTIFCPFTLLTTQKIKSLKNWKKRLEILSFYICVPQMIIIWCIVPETWSVKDKIFCNFGRFFAFLSPNNPKNQNFGKMKKKTGDIIILHMCTINGNHMIMVPEIWSMTDRIFCHFGLFFALLPP